MRKRRNKNRRSRESSRTSNAPAGADVREFPSGRKMRVGELGVFDRAYPPKAERDRVIETIRTVPEERRSPDQWWILGEYLVYGGLIEENEAVVNEGVGVLMRGASLAEPSTACLLDLAWILAFKGMDAMALPYIERASSTQPKSRDIAAMKAHIHMGMGDAAGAIAALEIAVASPNAAEGDRESLAALRSGQDPRTLRKRLTLRKIGLEDPELVSYPSAERTLVAVHVAKQIYDSDPKDPAAAAALGYARYCANQLDRAKPLILSSLGADPKQAHLWTILGLIEKKAGNSDGEVEMYRKALEADPDYVLALVNLASRIQDKDPHEARPLLEHAFRVAEPGNPHLAVALDLMGNNVGLIEQDYRREADYHRQALRLAPDNGLAAYNLVVSLLCAGLPRDARRAWQAHKGYIERLKTPLPIESVIRAFVDESLHPYECLQMVETFEPFFGKPGLSLLVDRAWKRRAHVLPDERLAFLSNLGMFATKLDCDDLAVSIWREAAALDPTGQVAVNEAVALDKAGHHAEALDLVQRLAPVNDRHHTCLGNIRWNAGFLKPAVEAYRIAVETEAIFELPYTNAFECSKRLSEPELVRPFIDRLETAWPDGRKKNLLLGLAHFVGARPSTACEYFRKALLREDREILPPEALFETVHDVEDVSLNVRPSADYHLAYADALIRARRLQELSQLVRAMYAMPRWANGDWKVLNAEIARLSGNAAELDDLLSGMDDQIPALISKALVAIENGDVELARSLVAPVLAHPSSEGFRHPEGRPDSLARAISAIVLRAEGRRDNAVAEGREAIARDVGCVLARVALVNALLDLQAEADAIGVLEDGLRRMPSEPRMVRLAAETLVSTGRISEAEEVLRQHRAGLAEFDATDLGFRLGEMISAARLAGLTASEGERRAAESDWPWIMSLEEPIQRWLIGAHRSRQNLDELRIAFMMYAGKIAEKLIADRLLVPFRKSLPDPAALADSQYRDFNAFVLGGRHPSIGGFVLLLRQINRRSKPSDSRLVLEFRNFILRLNWPDAGRLKDRSFVDAISHLAGTRNASAHTDEPGLDEIVRATSLIIEEDKPGQLFAALGIELI
jgi:tetratricopeptide (TPR) repeat protein